MSRTPQKQAGSRGYREAWRAVNLLIRSDGSWSGRERDVCYRNNGDGTFADSSFVTGLDSAGDGRAFATLDLNGDGSLDIVLASRTAPRIQVLRNQPAGDALVLELRGAGKSNRDAIGAVAELRTNRRTLLRTVQAGSGYLSQSSRRLHFALEPGERVDGLDVAWPDGEKQTVSAAPARGTYRLVQGSGGLQAISGAVLQRVAQPAAPASPWLTEPVPAPPLTGWRPGRPTLLNFWASWCPPCRQEMGEWTASAAAFQRAGLDVVIVSVDEDKSKKPAAPFAVLQPSSNDIAAWNLFHRHLFDRRQDIGLPMSFLLDAQGRVTKVYKGVTPSARIVADLRATARPALPFPGRWMAEPPGRNWVELATALAEHGLAAQSIPYFEQALAQGQPTVEALNNFAGVLLETGRLEEADALLQKTLTLFPRHPDALANLGTLRLKQNQPTAARDLFRQVLATQPDDAFAQHGLGSALFARQDYAAARQAFEQALRLDPGNPNYRYSLASVLAASGDLKGALAVFQALLPERSDSTDLANNLGILYAETGDAGKAEAEFRRAMGVAPEHPAAYLNLARLYQRQGKIAEARQVLDGLLQREPNLAQAVEMRNALR
ncbi:MAG: tetratricopeptide repeat protein [Bryobacterales bacterium]|nr:tetratricopeptide repeat protein [Bryobacterales bacterium]